MDGTRDGAGSQSSCGAATPQSYESSHEPVTTVAPTLKVGECEPVDALLQVDLWQPGEPQYCKAVAEHYGVSRSSVQK